MLRILVEFIEEGIVYDEKEAREFAKKLDGYFKKNFNRRLHDVDSGPDWFVGFVHLPVDKRPDIHETIQEWASEGIGTEYTIEDMENPEEGPLCGYNSGVCKGCRFAFNGTEPCRIGCQEA